MAEEAVTGMFDRVVCGVDGTPESLAAVRQAARLQPSAERLLFVGAISLRKTGSACGSSAKGLRVGSVPVFGRPT
jgi:hypothetical protein